MTFSSAHEQPALLPPRLSAAVVAATIAAHLCLIAALGFSAPTPQVLAPLNIEMIPQGDYFVDTAQVDGAAAEPPSQERTPPPEQVAEVKPAEEPQAQPEAQTQPEAAAARIAPASQARDAELEAQLHKRAAETRTHARAREKSEEKSEEKAHEKQRLERQRERRKQKRLAEARAGGGSEAHRAGRRDGQAARGATANYPLLVSAELNRHKAYPAAAKARGETGTVGASFTVGASGRIVAHRITRSSGSAALDDAVRAMMGSAQAPPPPGGMFHGSIAIHFNLSR